MAKSRGLGRGLESLIPAAPPVAERDAPLREGGDGVWELKVDHIVANRWQPRRDFDSERLEELARSIDSDGLINPLVVRRSNDGGYELIAGERRLRAMRDILKRETVPVRLMRVEDARMRELALVENLQREDLNPIEEATAFDEMVSKLGLTHEEVAKRLNKASGYRSVITNRIRLLTLPEEVKRLVAERELEPTKARALAALENPVLQIKLARRIVEEGLSAAQVEKLVADLKKEKNRAPAPEKTVPPHVADLEDRLTHHFGSKVVVEDNNGKGRIVVEYYSVDDAQRILERMGVRMGDLE